MLAVKKSPDGTRCRSRHSARSPGAVPGRALSTGTILAEVREGTRTSSGDNGSSAAAARTCGDLDKQVAGHELRAPPVENSHSGSIAMYWSGGGLSRMRKGRTRPPRCGRIARTAARTRRVCPEIRSARCTRRSRCRCRAPMRWSTPAPATARTPSFVRFPCAPPADTHPGIPRSGRPRPCRASRHCGACHVLRGVQLRRPCGTCRTR